jgi:hypothetical protein
MRRAFASLAVLMTALALAACSTQPETLPNPYVSQARQPVRAIGYAAGSSPFAAATAAALGQRGFAMAEIDPAVAAGAAAGAYVDYAALRALAAQGVDAVLTVKAARGGTGPLDGMEDFAMLDRASAASATVTATADGAVVAAADWRPRLGWHVGPTPTRSASGPLLQSEAFAPPEQQLADVLAAQISR